MTVPKKPQMSRREFVRTMGTGLATLPLLPMIYSWRVQAQAAAPRYWITFHTSNGVAAQGWLNSGPVRGFDLSQSQILAPLAPHREDLIIANGINSGSTAGGHRRVGGGILTGRECTGEKESSVHTNISLDQFVADRLRGQTRFDSLLLLAAHQRGADFMDRADYYVMSAKGPNLPVLPEVDPQKAFDRLFADFVPSGGSPDPALAALRAKRRSVLDGVARELQSLMARLTGSEREKIDQHLTSIRDIERTLQDPENNGMCSPPSRPGAINPYDNDSLPTRWRLMARLMVEAMACDLTRIGTISIEGGQGWSNFRWIGLPGNHHEDYSHIHGPEQVQINHWFAEEFAYFLSLLKGYPNLFANTVVYWTSEIGKQGSTHTTSDLPIVLAGSCGGVFKTGRLLSLSGRKDTQVLTTIMNAMGVPGSTFGNVTAAPIPELITA